MFVCATSRAASSTPRLRKRTTPARALTGYALSELPRIWFLAYGATTHKCEATNAVIGQIRIIELVAHRTLGALPIGANATIQIRLRLLQTFNVFLRICVLFEFSGVRFSLAAVWWINESYLALATGSHQRRTVESRFAIHETSNQIAM